MMLEVNQLVTAGSVNAPKTRNDLAVASCATQLELSRAFLHAEMSLHLKTTLRHNRNAEQSQCHNPCAEQSLRHNRMKRRAHRQNITA